MILTGVIRTSQKQGRSSDGNQRCHWIMGWWEQLIGSNLK